MTQHFLFITGKLAEQRLHRVLAGLQNREFSYEIRNIGVSVAALITAQMLKRRLQDIDGVDCIYVPGLCRGDLGELEQALGVPVIRGTVDVKDLPSLFGEQAETVSLDHHDVRIFAEIVDAPVISTQQIVERAQRYAEDGADIIDIGCLPDTPFPHLEESVKALKAAGFSVSIDSLEDDDLLRGGRAGADYMLSLRESTAWIADEVDATPVLIPEEHGNMPSLFRLIEVFTDKNRRFLADSVLDPVHFGFTTSISRYAELCRQYPGVEVMMGTGNLTELTEADTTGIQAILFGIISELGIGNILTTEVSPHTRSVVREADYARRLMFAARETQGLPKGIGSALLTTHERKPFPYDDSEVKELAAQIRDPSYRIEVTDTGIHVFNRDGLVSAKDAFTLYPLLGLLQEDAPHAFYMGVELARAETAFKLGKRYVQDEDLYWGVAVDRDETAGTTGSKIAHDLRGVPADDESEGYKESGATLKSGVK